MVMAVPPSITFAPTTAATPTDVMRRDNQLRDVISPVSQNEGAARESGIGSGADRAPMAGVPSFANQLAGARHEAENIRRRAKKDDEGADETRSGEQLSKEEQEKVEELKARDAEVRRHEQTHASIGGQYAGSPNYDMQQGPDGRSYAVGGSVDIDVSPITNDPEATIQKMQVVQRAALAVDEPSAADRNIASKASQQEMAARQQLAEENQPQQAGKPEQENALGQGQASKIENTYQTSFQPRQVSVQAQA